jgi:hypothetical protein
MSPAFAPHRSQTMAQTPSGKSFEDSLFTIPLYTARAVPHRLNAVLQAER